MKRVSWLVACAFGVVLYAAACTSHGEGGRCDPNNTGTDGTYLDCNSGLTCVSGLELALPDGGGHPAGDFCCPASAQDRAALPPGDICAGNPSSPGSDASIPDGAFNDVTTTDATSDQSTSDVSTDAPEDTTTTDAADDASDAATE